MNPLAYALLSLQLAVTPPSASIQQPVIQARPDRWLAEDKMKHMVMSAAVVGFAQAGARTITDARSAVVIGAVAGVAAGIWKELRDQRIGRPFSERDLIWDAVGIGLGVLLTSRAR